MRSAKFKVIALSLLIAFVGGATHQIFTPREVMSQMDVAFDLVDLALIFLWYRLDTEERQFRRSALLSTMIVAITVIALPYYFFRTRGFARGALATVLLVGVGVLYTATQYGGEYTAYYVSRSNLHWSGP